MGKKHKEHKKEHKKKHKKHGSKGDPKNAPASDQAAREEQEARKRRKQEKRAAREEQQRPAAQAAAPAGTGNGSSLTSGGSSSGITISGDDSPAAAATAGALSDSDGSEQVAAGTATTAAAAAAAAAAPTKSVTEVLADDGYVACEVGECDLDLAGINDPDRKELWVLRLPDGVGVEQLQGHHIHLPSALPDARHLHPPPNPFEDAGADLLGYVQAAVPAQNVGQMSLGAETAERTGNHQFRQVLQQHEFEAMSYSIVAAPAAHGSGGSGGGRRAGGLQLLKVGRFLHLTSDSGLVNKQRARQASLAGAACWAAADGWDSVLLPRRQLRRRIAGWQVAGGASSPQNNDDGEEEEQFEEDVFFTKASGEQQQQQKQQLTGSSKKQRREAAGSALAAAAAGSELEPRLYSDLEDEDADDAAAASLGAAAVGPARVQVPLKGVAAEDRALPGGGEAPFAADLQQWVASLPVTARTAMLQQATAQTVSAQQWIADRAAWWQQSPQSEFLAPADAGRQAQLLQQLAALRDSTSNESDGSSDDDSSDEDEDGMTDAAAAGAGAAAASKVVVLEDLGHVSDSSDDDDDEDGGSKQQQQQGGRSANKVSAQLADEARAEYPCPLPLAQLAALPAEVEALLAGIKGARSQQRLRNAAVRLFTNWREVWVQVDQDALSDDELWQLVQAMPGQLRRTLTIGLDRERARRLKQRQQQAAVLGAQMVAAPPSRRPHYTATDAGYAPYQAAGEPRVGIAADNPGLPEEDDKMAAWLVSQGAGKQQRLVDAEELRNRGLDWDDDPAHLRREGLHVVLPDGRDVHIPAGTDLDWQGQLQKAWGYDKMGQ